jgi:hypothetical protein
LKSPPGWVSEVKPGDKLLVHSLSREKGVGKGKATVVELPLLGRKGWEIKVTSDTGQFPGKQNYVVTDLMPAGQIGSGLTPNPPSWYRTLVDEVSTGIASDLEKEKANLTKKDHSFTGPGNHVYNDAVIIAMGSGLRQMIAKLGLANQSVVVPELNRNLFVINEVERFAYINYLDSPTPTDPARTIDRLPGGCAAAMTMDLTSLGTKAVAAYKADNPHATISHDDAAKAIVGEKGKNPARTSRGVVLVNVPLLTNLASQPSDELNAFVHLIIHEFVHANSAGGGGLALAGHGALNDAHEEGVTDTIARAISDAINKARTTGDPSTKAIVAAAVPEIKAMTFGADTGVRYQSEVDMVLAKIVDRSTLQKAIAKPYFTGADKDEAGKALG